MDYLGQLVVLRTQWRLNADRLGVVVAQKEEQSDAFLVMWTTKDGIKMKYHLQDALLPVTLQTIDKIEERICAIK